MDFRTFFHTTQALVTELEDRLQPNWATAIRQLLDHGEEGMALNQLISALVRYEIPVSPEQRDTLYGLITYFPPPDGGWSRHVPYLMTASIDWLTIVDE